MSMADDLLLVFVEQAKLEGKTLEDIEKMLERELWPYGKPVRYRPDPGIDPNRRMRDVYDSYKYWYDSKTGKCSY